MTKKEWFLLVETVRLARHWHYCFLMDGGQYEESTPAMKKQMTRTRTRLLKAQQIAEKLKPINRK